MSFRTLKIFTLVITCLVFIISCGPEPEQAPIIIETSNSVRPFETTEWPIANCGSDQALQTEQRVDQPFTHEVNIVRSPDSEQNLQSLKQAVRDHYEISELVGIASQTVVANVPPGSIFTYQIEWSQTWREGNIEIGEIDDNPEATYEFLEALTGAVVEIETAPCS